MHSFLAILKPCANPKCWRLFLTTILSDRECCDAECDQQRRAIEAKQARLREAASRAAVCESANLSA